MLKATFEIGSSNGLEKTRKISSFLFFQLDHNVKKGIILHKILPHPTKPTQTRLCYMSNILRATPSNIGPPNKGAPKTKRHLKMKKEVVNQLHLLVAHHTSVKDTI